MGDPSVGQVIGVCDQCLAAGIAYRGIEIVAVSVGQFQDAVGDFDGDEQGARVGVGANEPCIDEYRVHLFGECAHTTLVELRSTSHNRAALGCSQ